MPLVNPSCVVSFSSEDPNHPANNLLNRDTFRKWKCKEAGEKEAFVILKFDKAVSLIGIDIGNESSAMVEVLVGRSGGSGDVKYETLLSSSVLMSPADSRTLKNPNGVRNYNASTFDRETAAQKWDLVKIVVSQIFNKQTQFGLTFVKFTAAADADEPAKIGIFSIRKPLGQTNDEDEEEPSRIGAMFAKSMNSKKDASDTSCKSTSAAIRETTKAISNAAQMADEDEVKNVIKKSKKELTVDKPTSIPSSSQRSVGSSDKLPNRNTLADSPFSKKKTNQTANSVSQGSVAGSPSSSTGLKQTASIKTKVVNNQDRNGQLSSGSQKTNQSYGTGNNLTRQVAQPASHSPSNSKSTSATSSSTNSRKKIEKRPFNKLFSGVIFVMSGFENPYRKELRDKAIEMGARCKPDWDSTCTHLICAWTATPKFRQVRQAGNGKIVKKDWIERSYEARCKIPWRIFCLDKNDQGPESEGEIWADDVGEEEEVMDQDDNSEEMPTGSVSSNGENNPENVEVDDGKIMGSQEDEDGSVQRRGRKRILQVESSDEEEGGSAGDLGGNPYDADTDVDEENQPNNSSMSKKSKNDGGGSGSDTDFEEDQEIPSAIKNNDDDTPVDSGFFENCVFFLSLPKGRSSSNQRSQIEQIISKRKGYSIKFRKRHPSKSRVIVVGESKPPELVESELTDNVEYFIVSSKSWSDEFSEALSDNPNMSFVHYEWILECEKKNKMVSCHPFIVKMD